MIMLSLSTHHHPKEKSCQVYNPQNVSWALEQNNVEAFSLSTEVERFSAFLL